MFFVFNKLSVKRWMNLLAIHNKFISRSKEMNQNFNSHLKTLLCYSPSSKKYLSRKDFPSFSWIWELHINLQYFSKPIMKIRSMNAKNTKKVKYLENCINFFFSFCLQFSKNTYENINIIKKSERTQNRTKNWCLNTFHN